MRVRFAAIALASVALLAFGRVLAQAPDCTVQQCTYLPIIEHNIVPTNTPTHTSTPTETPAVPTATATVAPAGVFVLPNHFAYVDTVEYLHIVGEVQNNTGQTIWLTRIAAKILNGSGQLVDTASTYTALDEIRPGEKACFNILTEEPAGWASYQFEPVTYSNFTGALPSLTIFDLSGGVDTTFDWYRVLGQVRNDGAAQVRFVSPVGTLYNAAGTVIGCTSTFVQSTDLSPGQASAFEMLFTGRDYSDAATFRVQVDGNID